MTRLGVIGHSRYAELPEVLRTLCELAPALGLELRLEPELRALAPSQAPLVSPEELDGMLTLGGDGTLLRGARFLGGLPVPMLGINLGRLGFLTCCPKGELPDALRHFARGDYTVESRMQLAASVLDAAGRERARWLALNDVVLHKGGFARVVRLQVRANDEPVATYGADGVVVATPTGSTAYSLSVGGPVVFPTLDTLLVAAVSPHTLAIRPLVLPAETRVSVRSDGALEQLLVTVDGQEGTSLAADETLVVCAAPVRVHIVRFAGQSFFATMQRKLGWGGPLERDTTTAT